MDDDTRQMFHRAIELLTAYLESTEETGTSFLKERASCLSTTETVDALYGLILTNAVLLGWLESATGRSQTEFLQELAARAA